MNILHLPLLEALQDAQTILLAGAGGGYDIYSGLPLYFGLRAAGKTVHLANLSFTSIYATTGRRMGEALVAIDADTDGSLRYFPEKHLAEWFRKERGEAVTIYCFDRTGVLPIATAYRNLVTHLGGVDAVVLIDGGTDSLMKGDEPDLGTPEEDVASIYAVDQLKDVATKLLVCVGFGVDTFHGVCHHYFLEAVSEIAAAGGYLGAWSLLPQMPEVEAYRSAIDYVHRFMFNHPSIVSTSILSAVEGRFGNYHANFRTTGSELFINPLMSLYWAFQLKSVARRNRYLEYIKDTETYIDLSAAIGRYREGIHDEKREWRSLPV